MGATQVPAGWYDDPLGPGGKRWWDGIQWTQHTELPQPAPPAPAPSDLFAGAGGHAGTSLPPTTTEARYLETDAAGGERPAWRQKRTLIPSLALLLGLGGGAVVIGAAVFGSVEPIQTAASGVEATEASVDQQINRLIDLPEDTGDSTSLTTSTASPTTARQTSSVNPSSTTEASTAAAAPESTTTPAAPTTARPTTAAPTIAVPTTAAPTTAAPVTAVPTTAAPTTAAPTSTAAPTTATTATVSCHPAYSPCLPNSPGDAYNCGDLLDSQKPVTVHDRNVDPYQLDRENDGVGCESG